VGMGGNGNGNGFMGMGGNWNRNSPSRTSLVRSQSVLSILEHSNDGRAVKTKAHAHTTDVRTQIGPVRASLTAIYFDIVTAPAATLLLQSQYILNSVGSE